MSLFKKSNNKISSRSQIAIKGVEDGILSLPGNKYRMILQVSSINFELKSEEEQDAIVETYQSFLNSLSTPIQVIIRVREMDVDRYLKNYEERLQHETEKIYKQQIVGYTKFVKELIKSNQILERQFYVVIPYQGKDKVDMSMVREQLQLNANIVDKGLSKLGMRTRKLDSLEVLDLFYSLYNPEKAKAQPLTDQTMDLLRKSYI